MASLPGIKRASALLQKMEAVFGRWPRDQDTGEVFDGCYYVLRRARWGRDYRQHPEFLQEENQIGDLPELYYALGEELMKAPPAWLIPGQNKPNK